MAPRARISLKYASMSSSPCCACGRGCVGGSDDSCSCSGCTGCMGAKGSSRRGFLARRCCGAAEVMARFTRSAAGIAYADRVTHDATRESREDEQYGKLLGALSVSGGRWRERGRGRDRGRERRRCSGSGRERRGRSDRRHRHGIDWWTHIRHGRHCWTRRHRRLNHREA